MVCKTCGRAVMRTGATGHAIRAASAPRFGGWTRGQRSSPRLRKEARRRIVARGAPWPRTRAAAAPPPPARGGAGDRLVAHRKGLVTVVGAAVRGRGRIWHPVDLAGGQ